MGQGGKQTEKAESRKVSGISHKYPTYRNSKVITVRSWLRGKQKDDGAEGLWRIYDTLYDFTTFAKVHPGGAFWLEETKGTDITEPFESHHISTLPSQILAKYKVRQAIQPRNYKFTMHEDGFYKTLKTRVREKLSDIDYSPKQRTDLFHLLLLLSSLAFVVLSARTQLAIFEVLAALSICWLAIASHNYFHRKNNWQMYAFNFTLLNFSDWRISHALSHHVYPNSLYDLEMSLFEPFLCYIPSKFHATKIQRIFSVLGQPLIYASIFLFSFITRLIVSITRKNVLYWHDIIGFLLPALMYLISEDLTIFSVLRQWILIILLSSFLFALIGLNAAHHDPEIHHDGDANRVDRDWGLFQIDTIIDRNDIKNSQFLVLTHFGEHALHHLFPTLDHGVLPQLNPILLKTLQEFGAGLREKNQLGQIIGQNRQLLRTEPNKIPPCSSSQKLSSEKKKK